MSPRQPSAYRFATRAQWQSCLTVGFESAAGGLATATSLGGSPQRLEGSGPATGIAADRFGEAVWRGAGADGATGLFWQDPCEGLCGPFPVDEIIAASPRLLLDRRRLSAFAADRLARYDRGSLQPDRLVRADALGVREGASILDIAPDGRGGLWLLVAVAGSERLLAIDTHGCPVADLPLPCPIVGAEQIAAVDDGRALAVLSPSDRRLHVLDAAGSLLRSRWLGTLAPGFEPERIAGDGAGRLALSGWIPGAAGRAWRLYPLDRFGEPLAPGLPGAGDAAPQDFAIGGDRIWLAAADGVWHLGGGDADAGPEVTAVLLTPLLHSPPGGETAGWLRAELDIDLPEGAGLSVSVGSTADTATAERIARIAADESQPHSLRQAEIWSLLEASGQGRAFTVKGGGGNARRLAFPLFGTSDPWLALRLTLDVPAFALRPRLRSLDVLYPEHTLMRDLPAIFSVPDGDPERLLRRLVGVIETTSQDLDARIAAIGRFLDAATAPPECLDFLGSWLDLPWHPALAEASKRALLRQASDLLRWRGTLRGLRLLLECLAGDGARVAVTDVMAERAPVRLGGGGRAGVPLRGLLAGRPSTSATLGAKAVLGRTRLACPGDPAGPLAILVPVLLIEIGGFPELRARNAGYLDAVLAQYLPVGVRHRVRWTDGGPGSVEGALVLDALGPGRLGATSRLGRTVLDGRPGDTIGTDIGMGFRLR